MIYLVEDDKSIRELLVYTLNNSGLPANGFEKPSEFYRELRADDADLIILDIMLPECDGLTMLKNLRADEKTKHIPVMMLTAKGETFDKVLGLELGADDYIVKPFDAKEVTARIKAVLRRSSAKEEENKGVYDFDNLHLDMNRYELKVKGKVVEAPPKELELLNCLASHPNRVYTRDQLLDEVWGFEYYGDSRTIDVHVRKIRQKIGDGHISTVKGMGYKYEN